MFTSERDVAGAGVEVPGLYWCVLSAGIGDTADRAVRINCDVEQHFGWFAPPSFDHFTLG
jgi:hypothetical protein